MKPASLVTILVLAKVAGLSSRTLPLSLWLPSVLFWDDVAVGVALWAIDRVVKRPRVTTAIYWIVIGWTVLNVPVVRALSSPLTVNMLGAAGGALRDSVTHYATAGNTLIVTCLLLLAWRLPRELARIPPLAAMISTLAAIAVALPGPLVERRVDVHGFERNAVTALVRTSLPRVEGRELAGEWRLSPMLGLASLTPVDLGSLRHAAAGRNVALIALESTAAQYLRSYGAADDPMPNLTWLAETAIQFDRAYAVYPESIKGLFALLCSRSPAFDIPAEVHARAACAPLARAFSTAGYRTALFHSGRFAYLGMQEVVARQGFETLEDAGAIGGNVQSSFGVDEPATVSRMLAWVDALGRDERFFLTYLPVAGHHPYPAAQPGPFAGSDDLSAYKNALYDGDRSLGALLQGLRARGHDRDTMFVLYGDHGEAFGQHDGNFGHTLFIYDENVRVPLYVSIPGVTTGRVTVPNVASTIDIAPTILELAGLPVPGAYEGQSLLEPRSRLALFQTDYSLGLFGLQDGCWKYIFEIDSSRSRLFDTCADPQESRDRALELPSRVRAYSARLRAWTSATRAAMERAP